MLNARLSKRSASAMNPPKRTHVACAAVSVPSSAAAPQRTAGTVATASPLASSIAQRAPSPSAPGQRPSASLSPSCCERAAVRDGCAAGAAGARPPALSSRYEAMARGVGWSKTSVGDTCIPVSARSRAASSVAPSESTPASISGIDGSSADPVNSCNARSTSVST
eukprot:3721343-Pleurochrysis_carterae.AAC.2